MPKKNAYSRETLQILESLWAQGMQNCSTSENKLKIQQAAVATGLVDERIKVWIYYRNRQRKKEDVGQTKKKQLLCRSTREESIPTKGMTHDAAGKVSQHVAEETDSEWTPQGQTDSQDTSSEEETSRAITDLPAGDPDKDGQQETAAQLIQSVENRIQELQACNCEVIFMVYNHSSGLLSTTGTLKGLAFVNSQNPGIHLQFGTAVSNSSCENTLN